MRDVQGVEGEAGVSGWKMASICGCIQVKRVIFSGKMQRRIKARRRLKTKAKTSVAMKRKTRYEFFVGLPVCPRLTGCEFILLTSLKLDLAYLTCF